MLYTYREAEETYYYDIAFPTHGPIFKKNAC